MSQTLIITGMHRSGTSMVSNLVQAAGVDLGDKLLPANSGNPRGYFEDVDFIAFHEQILAERQQHFLYLDDNFDFQPSEGEKQLATQLLIQRSKLPLWGWKDPRTSLFLDFWDQQIPDARFLFVFRHPLEVMLSLLRRSDFDHRQSLSAGLRSWQIYNAKIKSFYDRHPDRCLLVHIDGVTTKYAQFAHLVRQKLQLDARLDANSFERIYQTSELSRLQLPPEAATILDKTNPGLSDLYKQLNARADLPAVAGKSTAKPSALLSSAAALAANLQEPVNLATQQSLLLLLSSSLAPEPTERMLRTYREIQKHFPSTVQSTCQEVRNGHRQIDGFNRVHCAPAQLRTTERVALYSLIFGIQPRNCLEIGTAQGGSAAIMCAAMDDLGLGKLSCVDPMPQVSPELWAQLSHRCRLFEGPSPGILPQVAQQVGANFDFALIDGDHSYDAVRADIAGVLPYLADDAYILFHDAHHAGVKPAIDDTVATQPEISDCGLLSVESTILVEYGQPVAYAGFRLLRFRRSTASAPEAVSNVESLPAPEVAMPTAAPSVSDRRIPVILAGNECLSGVTTWAERLREQMAGHPRYDLQLLHVGREQPPGYSHYATTAEEARELMRSLAPAILVPNYVWDMYLASTIPGVSCLGMCHCDSVDEYYLPLSWYESTITRFIAVSAECTANLTNRLPFRANDITTLPYGVNVSDQLTRGYQTAPLRLFYAGRVIQPQKRAGDFVPLVANLLQMGTPFVFDIVGDGDEFYPLQHAMKQWFPNAAVRFHGRLPHDEVMRMWAAADVFVQTSDFEGTSISMLEAMAQGVVPVITAASSGVAGVIDHGKNGWVVPVGDMNAMARAIADLAANQVMLAAMGHAAHKTAKAYAIERYCERFTQVLDEIVDANRNVRPVKADGDFGGHHPLFVQHQIICSQQKKLTAIESERSVLNEVRRFIRRVRDRVAGRLEKPQQLRQAPVRKAA